MLLNLCMPLFSHWPCPIYFQLIAGLQLCSIYAHGLRGVKPGSAETQPPPTFKDSHGPLLTEHHSLPFTFKKEKLWKRCLCVWSVSGILEWKIKCVCVGACVRVCVCVCVCMVGNGQYTVHSTCAGLLFSSKSPPVHSSFKRSVGAPSRRVVLRPWGKQMRLWASQTLRMINGIQVFQASL